MTDKRVVVATDYADAVVLREGGVVSAEYEMFMPFVTTTDNGGIHDPAAYVAGFEMGHLDAVLGMTSHLNVIPGPVMLHAENRPQADLLAMKHGFKCTFEQVEGYDEWIACGFARADLEPPGEEDQL